MKTVLFMIFCVCFSACNLVSQQDKYMIAGKAPLHLNGEKVMLFTFENNEIRTIDSTLIAKGSFSFKGNSYSSEFSILTTGIYPDTIRSLKLFLEPGAIDVYLDTKSSARGTELNNIYQDYMEGVYALRKNCQEIEFANTQGKPTEELEKERERIDQLYPATNTDMIKQNISNPLGKELLIEHCMGMWNKDFLDIYAMADENLRADPLISKCYEWMKSLSEKEELRERLMGAKLTDFTLYTPDGDQVKMSDYIGDSKYVFFDIWASWCTVCIRDFKTLKEIYEKHKDNGFNVVAISIDENKEDWIKSVQKHELPWPQLLATDNIEEIKEAYGLAGLPCPILVDQNGTIVIVGYPAGAAKGMIDNLMKQNY